MLGETGNMSRDKVLAYIEHANDLEIQEIMDAVERRFALAYPQWDVLYTAVHKDPELRRKDLQELTVYIEKDLQWYADNQKKDSLG